MLGAVAAHIDRNETFFFRAARLKRDSLGSKDDLAFQALASLPDGAGTAAFVTRLEVLTKGRADV